MATSVQNSFQLIAVINGTSINGTLQVDNGPLLQAYSKGVDRYTPDWGALAENKRPVVYPALIDLSTGQPMVPNTVTYKYNGIDVTFGEDGLSTNKGWEGAFKLVTGYSATIAGKTATLTAMRVMKNLVPLSGGDNDRISCSGTIEQNGQSIAFNELSTTVVIQESGGSAYYLHLYADNTALTTAGATTKVYADLYKDAQKMNDLTGFSFMWRKRSAAGDTDLGTTQSVTVSTNDIDGALTLVCSALQGAAEIAANQIQVFDFSDSYQLRFRCEGATAPYIQPGQTAVFTPYIVSPSTGAEATDVHPSYSFYTRDNDGKDLLPTGQTKLPFTAESVSFTYDDTQKRAKGSINGYVTATF